MRIKVLKHQGVEEGCGISDGSGASGWLTKCVGAEVAYRGLLL